MIDEIYSELCDAMDVAKEVDAGILDAADGGVVNSVLIGVIGRWVADQVRQRTCENAPVILEAVEKWLKQFVKSEQAVVVLLQVAELAIGIVCSQQPQ